MAFAANGSKFFFGGTEVAGVDKITATVNGAEIDITTLASAEKLKECGLPDLRFNLTGKGVPVPTICELDTVEYVAPGGSKTAVHPNKFFVSERVIRTAVDGAVTFSLKFTPSTTLAAA